VIQAAADCTCRLKRVAFERVEAAELPPLSDDPMGKIRDIYEQDIKPYVHQRW